MFFIAQGASIERIGAAGQRQAPHDQGQTKPRSHAPSLPTRVDPDVTAATPLQRRRLGRLRHGPGEMRRDRTPWSTRTMLVSLATERKLDRRDDGRGSDILGSGPRAVK